MSDEVFAAATINEEFIAIIFVISFDLYSDDGVVNAANSVCGRIGVKSNLERLLDLITINAIVNVYMLVVVS